MKITTLKQINALPEGSVITAPFDCEGNIAERVHDGWLITGEPGLVSSTELAQEEEFTVLRIGYGHEQDGLDAIKAFVRVLDQDPTTEESQDAFTKSLRKAARA